MKMLFKLAKYRKAVLATSFLFLVVISSMLFSSAVVTWSANQIRVTTYGGFDGLPTITQTKDGRIWVAWTKSVSGDYSIVYQTSSDFGVSWSPETIMTTDANVDTAPSIFQDMNGSIWVVWSSSRTGGYDLYYKISSNGGLNWTDAKRLTTDPDSNKLPSIAQTSDGNVWISWSSRNAQEEYEIFYMTYNGSSWSNKTQLTTAPNEVDTDPAIIETIDGTIYVFWASRGTGPSAQTDDLYYMYSSNNGVAWSDRILFTKDSIQYDDTWPAVTQIRDTSILVAWTSNIADQPDGNWDIYLKFSLAGDVNEDGFVDIFDLTLVAQAFGSVAGDPKYNLTADINKDGRVDMRDLIIVSKHYGAT